MLHVQNGQKQVGKVDWKVSVYRVYILSYNYYVHSNAYNTYSLVNYTTLYSIFLS